jgi:hypothetical protein
VPYFQQDEEVFKATDTTGEDDGSSFEMAIETGLLKPQTPTPRGWGRVRGVSLHEAFKSYDLQVQVFDANGVRSLLSKTSSSMDARDQIWPASPAREFRCTSQRCSACSVRLVAIPAVAEWSTIDLWVANSGDMAPPAQRS